MKVKCDNCGDTGESDQIKITFDEIPGLLQRIMPGEVVPYGECPLCKCFVYPMPEDVTVKFGMDGQFEETYEFGSEQERTGFLTGLNECDGWLESEVVETDES